MPQDNQTPPARTPAGNSNNTATNSGGKVTANGQGHSTPTTATGR